MFATCSLTSLIFDLLPYIALKVDDELREALEIVEFFRVPVVSMVSFAGFIVITDNALARTAIKQ
jgi:hypothetical protein